MYHPEKSGHIIKLQLTSSMKNNILMPESVLYLNYLYKFTLFLAIKYLLNVIFLNKLYIERVILSLNSDIAQLNDPRRR